MRKLLMVKTPMTSLNHKEELLRVKTPSTSLNHKTLEELLMVKTPTASLNRRKVPKEKFFKEHNWWFVKRLYWRIPSVQIVKKALLRKGPSN